MSVQNFVFRAQWDRSSENLRNTIPTAFEKVKRVAWNVFSVLIPIIGLIRLMGCAIGAIASLAILPGAFYMPRARIEDAKSRIDSFWKGPLSDENRKARENFCIQEPMVATPDGAILDVKVLKHREADGETPTWIYFNGNYQLALEPHLPWLVQTAIEKEKRCNFVFFNYRGVGDSQGNFSQAKDLVVDGFSVVQWVRKELRTPDDRIHFYGMSLGGAVAAQTQALDPDRLTGRHLNERSFASLDSMVQSMFGSKCLGKLLGWSVKNQGHVADAATAVKSLKGKRFIVLHPEDPVIRYRASLLCELSEDRAICSDGKRLKAPYDRMSLVPLEGEREMATSDRPGGAVRKVSYRELSKNYAHTAPLSWHQGIHRIESFLFDDF